MKKVKLQDLERNQMHGQGKGAVACLVLHDGEWC